MRLEAHEFIRRFLLHVLPAGFQRIRHAGFLANSHRRAKLAVIRALLAGKPPAPAIDPQTGDNAPAKPDSVAPASCPICGKAMIVIEIFQAARRNWRARLDRS